MRNSVTTRPRAGGGGRPPFDSMPGGGGDGHGGGDGWPDYSERLRRYRLGISIALVSIVTVFVVMGGAYLLREGFATYDPLTGTYVRDWQPLKLPIRILWIDTLLLLASSATLELARRQSIRDAALAPALRIPGVADDHCPFPWLPVTIALGFGFLAGQCAAWAFIQRHLTAPNSASNYFFYILTGTHALHLTAGLVTLLYAVLLKWQHKPCQQRRIVLDVVSWYWHVIGVLWMYLFALLQLSS